MTQIYFAGQDNFGNRGCEALVRANVKTIRRFDSDSCFFVPTRRMERDSAQWLSAGEQGVKFIPAEPIPCAIRWWSRGRRVLSVLDGFPPAYRVTDATRRSIQECDALVMTGGDIISLDYGLESLYYWSRVCETAMELRIPTVLWAASVGPFDATPSAARRMKQFLNRFTLITVRERASIDYLESLGIKGVELVADPAFVLDATDPPASTLRIFGEGRPVLGFNVSPLIRKFREGSAGAAELDREVVSFLVRTLKEGDFNVLLVPHVDPLDGSSDNSDSAYMAGILEDCRKWGFSTDRIEMLPRTLNASELKGAISRCDFFMGARTHATIAAISQGVPTTSIAYSVKAKGINQDLFGHTRYVLETPSVTCESLITHFERLRSESGAIKELLARQLPVWKKSAGRSAELLIELIATRRTAVA